MSEERSRDWIWFFAILTVLGTAAVVIPIVYNLGLQLTQQQVEQARERWQAVGPTDYDLDYQQRHTLNGDTEETEYRVFVRNGHVSAVFCDGRLTMLAGTAEGLALGPVPRGLPGSLGALDIDGMFEYIDSQLRQDLNLSHRPYATATFDKADGHPMRYVRRIHGGAERLEWTAKLQRDVNPSATPKMMSR
jgi:hypothetical protein